MMQTKAQEKFSIWRTKSLTSSKPRLDEIKSIERANSLISSALIRNQHESIIQTEEQDKFTTERSKSLTSSKPRLGGILSYGRAKSLASSKPRLEGIKSFRHEQPASRARSVNKGYRKHKSGIEETEFNKEFSVWESPLYLEGERELKSNILENLKKEVEREKCKRKEDENMIETDPFHDRLRAEYREKRNQMTSNHIDYIKKVDYFNQPTELEHEMKRGDLIEIL